MEKNDFKYLVDQFADIKVLRYRVNDFASLTFKQKKYIYYLSEAAKSGRDIIWAQLNKDNLIVRKTIENIIKTYSGARNTKAYANFLVYAKRVFFSNGINHHYSKDKIFPAVSPRYFRSLINNSNQENINKNILDFPNYMVDIIYSPEVMQGDLLQRSRVTFYENVSEKEAKDFYEKKNNKNVREPVEHGLNSKLVKENGILTEIIYKSSGLYGKAITQIIYWLEKALAEAENDEQKNYIKLLIKYYETGDLKIWSEYSIKWLQENEGTIDFINGFIEVYDDPIAIKGSWEALINVKDEQATKITNIIATNAQWFEDNSPIDPKFKKAKASGISAKVISAITLAGDAYPAAPVGINLPNQNWIREQYGSKSVSIINLTNAIDMASLEQKRNAKGEFSFDKSNLKKRRELNIIGSEMLTHLHECLGHGSGLILPNIAPNALKEYHSALEEARADLFGLYFLADKKLLELKVLASLDVAKEYYQSYIVNGLQTQLVRIELGKDIVQAHMQGRQLICRWAYKIGFKDKVIEKKIKDNKTYFVVNDFLKLREIFAFMLAEMQRIRSEGDYQAGKDLIEKYGTKIDLALHKETLERYQKLKLKPYTGWINPDLKLTKNDVKIIYPDDFLAQQLEYGENYSFL